MTIYPHRDASFKSSYTLSESVARLFSRVKNRRLIRSLLPQHLHPLRFYAGVMQFRGTFSERNGSTQLSGRFEVPKCGRVLMNTWFVVTIILLCLPYIFEISEPASAAILTLSVFMIFLWIIMILISYRRGKIDDIEYISREINDAIVTKRRHE